MPVAMSAKLAEYNRHFSKEDSYGSYTSPYAYSPPRRRLTIEEDEFNSTTIAFPDQSNKKYLDSATGVGTSAHRRHSDFYYNPQTHIYTDSSLRNKFTTVTLASSHSTATDSTSAMLAQRKHSVAPLSSDSAPPKRISSLMHNNGIAASPSSSSSSSHNRSSRTYSTEWSASPSSTATASFAMSSSPKTTSNQTLYYQNGASSSNYYGSKDKISPPSSSSTALSSLQTGPSYGNMRNSVSSSNLLNNSSSSSSRQRNIFDSNSDEPTNLNKEAAFSSRRPKLYSPSRPTPDTPSRISSKLNMLKLSELEERESNSEKLLKEKKELQNVNKILHVSKPNIGSGLVGLRNLGNTCFMNSCLQCLKSSMRLASYFLDGRYSKEINSKNKMKGSLARAFGDLMKSLWTATDYSGIAPTEFKREVEKWAPRFSGYRQHDAQEFLRFLLDGLHEDLSRITEKPPYKEEVFEDYDPEDVKANKAWEYHRNRNDSFIIDVFGGQLKSTVTCCTCKHQSHCFDPFMDLSLPIPKGEKQIRRLIGINDACSLEECLQRFTEEENLTGKEKYYCSRCKTHRNSQKKLTIYRAPPILVVHLKRFYYRYSFREKITSAVTFPLTNLNLGQYCEGPSSENLYYELFAVSNHHGESVGAGHYTAMCKSVDDECWYNFDDSRCNKLLTTDKITSDSAYILFYHRVSPT